MHTHLARWMLFFALLGIGLGAQAAGFDCARAKTSTEKAICADSGLSSLDEVLELMYSSALRNAATPDAIRSEQRAWLQLRNACGSDSACLQEAYQQRLAALPAEELFAADGSASIRCDAETETVTLTPRLSSEVSAAAPVPRAEWGMERSTRIGRKGSAVLRVTSSDRHVECLLASGRAVRVKLGDTYRWPYGRCGADPGTFFSAWVDKVRRVSREDVKGSCGMEMLVKAVISQQGVRVCRLDTVYNKVECRSIEWTHAANVPDRREYPARSFAGKPPLGSYVIEYSANASLCESLLFKPSSKPEKSYWHIGPPVAAQVDLVEEDDEYTGGTPLVDRQVSRFDMNNDGRDELVVSIHRADRSRDSNSFLAQRDDAALALSPDQLDKGFLAQHTAMVFPHRWGMCRGELDAREDDDSCDIPLQHYSPDGKPFRLAVHRLRFVVFRATGRTYFLGLTPYFLDNPLAILWDPQPSGAANEVCVFRQVVNNY